MRRATPCDAPIATHRYALMARFKPETTLDAPMPKPLVEQSTTLKAGKKGKKAGKATEEVTPSKPRIEAVGGGSVRVVEFEEEAPKPRSGEVHYEPKHQASMDHIHFEVDNLDRLQRGTTPRRAKPLETKRVFETEKGGVNATSVETHRGTRRVLYTERKRGNRTEETRFHPGLVDKIIAERYRDGPTFEAVDEESKPRFGLFKKKDDKPSESKVTKTVTKTVTKDGKTTSTTKTTKSTGWEPPTKAATQETDGKHCAAYTKDGDQCKRDVKGRAKYCFQHRGYRPPTKADLAK